MITLLKYVKVDTDYVTIEMICYHIKMLLYTEILRSNHTYIETNFLGLLIFTIL